MNVNCDLNKLFLEYQKNFITDTPDFFELSSGFVEINNHKLCTDQLSIELGKSRYGDSVLIDSIFMKANRCTFINLGLCIFAYLLGTPKNILNIRLNANDSCLSDIQLGHFGVLEQDWPLDGLVELPSSYRYVQREVEYVPCRFSGLLDADLPRVEVSFSADQDFSESQEDRSLLRGFGTPRALALFAGLLIDFGLSRSEVDEIALSAFPRNYCVAAQSAEIFLLLNDSPLA